MEAEAEEPHGAVAVSMEVPRVVEVEERGEGGKHGVLWCSGGEAEK